ncbi:MAG TPA: AtpZ/AtpI family protein [Phycisphaerae bacterium]|nr:AtpZ/AtpI family protein [Phycisphaerae bacterium]HRW52545.1 AtpZ/AtpI family protein [Phycisphaerae bacterium]
MEESPKPPKRNQDARFIAQAMRYSGVVTEFVACLGVLGFIGHKADEKYGTDPWLLLVGLMLGLGLGLFVMIRQLDKLNG